MREKKKADFFFKGMVMEHLIYYFLLHINGHLETVGSSRKTQPQHKQTQLREAGDEEIQLETESLLRRELLGDL